MNALIYHVASGQAFFSGVGFVSVAVISAFWMTGRWWRVGRTALAALGLILIAASATPLPDWFTLGVGLASVAWVGFEGTTSDRFRSTRIGLRSVVLAAWWLGVAHELPYHLMPELPALGNPRVYIVGDSIGAGMNDESETWPKILAERHRIDVVDLSRAGADVARGRKQADQIVEPGALVVVEIGGNDVLGATPTGSFEANLGALLATLRSNGRTVLMLELPLPPFHHHYGEIQRRLAERHGVALVPKRILLGVLTSGGSTLDSIHLSGDGHASMAETIWNLIRPAFRPLRIYGTPR